MAEGIDVPEGTGVTGVGCLFNNTSHYLIEGIDLTDGTDVAEGTDVTEGTGVTEGVGCFLYNTSHYLIEGIDLTEGTDVTEGADVTEGTDVTEGADVTAGGKAGVRAESSKRASGPELGKKCCFGKAIQIEISIFRNVDILGNL